MRKARVRGAMSLYIHTKLNEEPLITFLSHKIQTRSRHREQERIQVVTLGWNGSVWRACFVLAETPSQYNAFISSSTIISGAQSPTFSEPLQSKNLTCNSFVTFVKLHQRRTQWVVRPVAFVSACVCVCILNSAANRAV